MSNTPSAFEQAVLEYINQARMNPAGEFDVIIADAGSGTATQSNVTSALNYFGVDIEAFRSQMAVFDPVAPLAWNTALATAADSHSQLMIDTDTQSHRLPGELGLGDRITEAGYDWSRVSENIFAYTRDPLYGHAGFMVDWGFDDEDFDANGVRYDDWQTRGDGMQDPAGHRNAILSEHWSDVGISALAENDPNTQVGPYVVTQNFGAPRGANPAQLVGVVIDDADGDRFYDIGEGLGGVTVTAFNGTGSFTTTTWDAGGYQIELDPGTYTVEFSGGALQGVAHYSVTIGTDNVKLDGFAADAAVRDALLSDGFEALYFPEISDQVYRLYQAVLGRAPDNGGHLAWTERLALEDRALVDVAAGFMGSPEYAARFGMPDDAEFVTLLYQNVLGRAPDANGLARWTGDLADGVTRAEVIVGFSESAEFRADTMADARAFGQSNSPSIWSDDVYRLYQATLDREPDLNGFLNWAGRLGSGTDYVEVANGFVNSPQFNATYSNGLTNAEFVTLMYDNVLDRAPDATGLTNWTDRMDAGMTRAEVVRGFAQSAEFVAKTAQNVTAWVRAQGTDDVLQSGAGGSLMAGGMLSDLFVFQANETTSTVLGLERWDMLDFSALGLNLNQIDPLYFTQDGADVVFSDLAGTRVVFENTALSELSDDMILA
ncbi:MAG: DUF4214 domain-containing protein [Pseudomonadota bacterium]